MTRPRQPKSRVQLSNGPACPAGPKASVPSNDHVLGSWSCIQPFAHEERCPAACFLQLQMILSPTCLVCVRLEKSLFVRHHGGCPVRMLQDMTF